MQTTCNLQPPEPEKEQHVQVTPQRSPEVAKFAVEIAAAPEPPKEFRLFRAGLNECIDGRGPYVFDAVSATACMKHAASWGVDYALDYEHASLSPLKMDPAEAGKAAGWFRLAVRGGELWATDVKWTPKGRERLQAREYRYVSPAANFEKMKDGQQRITQLINCALTNTPALTQQAPLMAASLKTADAPGLTEEQRDACERLRIDPTQYASHLAHRPVREVVPRATRTFPAPCDK
jgi:phage I-like protein